MASHHHGGDPRKARCWRRQIERWHSSGMSISRFCRSSGFSESLFYYWRRTIAQRDGQVRERGGGLFVPVRVTEDEPGSLPGGIEIVLAGDRRIRVNGRVDRQMLADVVAVVEGQAC
jgi:transposase